MLTSRRAFRRLANCYSCKLHTHVRCGSRGAKHTLVKTKLFLIAILVPFLSTPLRAAILVGNFWPNPTFEAGVNLDLPTGTPESWNRGGSDGTIDQVSTANSVSATHSLAVIDNGPGFGEWYSDFTLAGSANVGDTLGLHWHEIYSIAAGNEMRVTVRFLDASGNGPDNHFVVSGDSAGWGGTLASSSFTQRNEELVVTPDAVTLRIQLASGGPESGSGQYIIDDLSVYVVPEPSATALLIVSGLTAASVLRRRRDCLGV